MAEMVIRAGLVQICFEEGSVCNLVLVLVLIKIGGKNKLVM